MTDLLAVLAVLVLLGGPVAALALLGTRITKLYNEGTPHE